MQGIEYELSAICIVSGLTICSQVKYLQFLELDRHITRTRMLVRTAYAVLPQTSFQNVMLSAEAPFYSNVQDRKFMPPRFGRKICRHPD